MNIAIKRNATVVDAEGRIAGMDAGATLVRRFLRLFPDAQLLGPTWQQADGFEVVPLDHIDPADTLIINFDVTDSPVLWEQILINSGGEGAHILNFIWFPIEPDAPETQKAALALSCALFPTFASSERVATSVDDLVRQLVVPSLAQKARLGWVNLGFRLDHVQARQPHTVPTVLYPAIYLSDRKRPEVFLRIVEKVRQRIPVNVQMQLDDVDLDRLAPRLLREFPWISPSPLHTSRAAYYDNLAQLAAFVATSADESYGLTYIEALGAGVVGIFPDLPWARALLPDNYPFLYPDGDEDAAAELLLSVISDPKWTTDQLDGVAGGSFATWLQQNHNDEAFDREVKHRVARWFGD